MNKEKNNNWEFKSRYLLLILLLSLILGYVLWYFLTPDYSDISSPLYDVLFDYCFYVVLVALLFSVTRGTSFQWRLLFGRFKMNYLDGENVLIIIPLIGISLFGLYLIFYPLSFLFPEFVNEWLISDEIKLYWSEGAYHNFANILSFVDVVLIAPIVEETIFRGLLLTSFANKFGIKKGIIFSSVIFGVFHADPIGSTIFGIVLSLVYLNSKSLFAPIIIHTSYNTVIFISSYFFEQFGIWSEYSLREFQNYYWLGLVGLLIGVPWLIMFYRKQINKQLLSIPYFVNKRV